MKKFFKLMGFLCLVIMLAFGFSSCEKEVNLPTEPTKNNDNSYKIVESNAINLDSILSILNTRTEIGSGSVYPTSGYVYEQNFDFEFESTNAAVANSLVTVYIVFSAPLGGSYEFQMNKQVTGTTTHCYLSKQLTQLGTYSFQFAIKVGSSEITTFGDTYYVTVLGHTFSYVNTYPWDGYTSGSDTWGYTKGWCTSYVAWKVHEMWNLGFHTGLGNAITWKDRLLAKGYTCDQNPLPGDIVWIQPGYYGTSSTYGHVGFVNERTSTYIKYTHYSGNTYDTTTVYLNNIGYRYFIHVQTKKGLFNII